MLSTLTKTHVAGALIGAAIAFIAVAPGPAAGQDLRTADARDAAEQVAPTDARGATTYPDVRTPDARDSAQQASPSEDQRSPDARDIPAPTFESQPIADTQPSPGGFDLLSAAIGAATGTGLLLMLAGFLAIGGLTGRRRHGTAGA
jgi:hypothetical protein